MQSSPPPDQPPYQSHYQPSDQQPYPTYPPHPVSSQPPRTGAAVPVVVIVLAVLAGALVFCCAVGALGGALFPTHAQIIPTANVPSQPLVSTQPATTPSTPTLGGTLTDVQQRFGAATDNSGLMYAATIAGQRVLILLTLQRFCNSCGNLTRTCANGCTR